MIEQMNLGSPQNNLPVSLTITGKNASHKWPSQCLTILISERVTYMLSLHNPK